MEWIGNWRGRLALILGLGLIALVVFYFVRLRAGHDYVRGVWITGYGTGYMTAGEVDRTIAAAKAAKINLIIVEVRKSADAYYKSDMEPMAPEVASGFDPLAYLLKKAHTARIKVHAWVSVCRVWRGNSQPEDPNHLVNRHDDWLARSYSGALNAPDGIFIDPGVPAARDYTVGVIADIVRRYDIDGLHLDFIRYPDAKWGYSETALKRYYSEVGTSIKPEPDNFLWQDWRREQVTQLVRDIRQEVRRLKPNVLMSAATITFGQCPAQFFETRAYKDLGQDWKRWLEEGLIDANMPMNYRDTRNPEKAYEFRQWLGAFRKWGGRKPVFVGLATYLSDEDTIETLIEETRKAGLDGFVVFCFNESGIRVVGNRDKLVSTLSRSESAHRGWDASCGKFLERK